MIDSIAKKETQMRRKFRKRFALIALSIISYIVMICAFVQKSNIEAHESDALQSLHDWSDKDIYEECNRLMLANFMDVVGLASAIGCIVALALFQADIISSKKNAKE